MILHRPTIDKCKEILNDERNKADQQVKVLDKQRGKVLTEYKGQMYYARDLYDIRRVQKEDLNAVLKRIDQELLPQAEASEWQQMVLDDDKIMGAFLQEYHKDKWDASVGKMTPVGIALSILEELRTKKKKNG